MPETISPIIPPPVLSRLRTGSAVLAAMTPVGPLLMSAWALAVPYDVTDDVATSIEKLASDPVGTQLSLTFLLLAGIFGSIGSLVVGSRIRRGAPRLGAAATALTFSGFIIAAYPGPLAAVAASREAGVSAVETERLVAAIDSQVQGVLSQTLFVALPAGILLLGVAALVSAIRRGDYPLWAAVLLAAAIPVSLLAGFISTIALAVGWLVVAAAFGIGGVLFARSARGR